MSQLMGPHSLSLVHDREGCDERQELESAGNDRRFKNRKLVRSSVVFHGSCLILSCV